MTVSVLARLVEENDKRLWRIIKHYVEAALAFVDMSEVEMLGMDETTTLIIAIQQAPTLTN